MPIKSEQQRKFMAMCLHSPEKAKGKCPPKNVAKKFIHGHNRKNESLDMTNQIDYRFALRALFEASLIAQIESDKIDEGFFNNLMTGAKRFGTRVKAGMAGFRGDAVGAQRFSNQADRMKSNDQRKAESDKAMADRRKARTLANIASIQTKRQATAARKRTAARKDKQANFQAGAATPEQKQKFKQTASTDHYRVGLKSLFEAILVEDDFVYNTNNSNLFKKKV